MTRIAAIVLAGGRAERLGGRNKALLEFGGTTLLERARRAAAGCTPLVAAIGRGGFETPGFLPVLDLATDYAGPLAGLAAAVDFLTARPPDLLFTLAVDTPFFPTDFCARAQALLATAPAVIAAFGAQDYPTNGLWRFDAIRTLADETRAGTAPRSLKRLAARLGATRLDYAEIAGMDPFLNVNTPEELTNLASRLDPPANV